VREAGGKVTGLDGAPFSVERPAVVAAANSVLHAELMEVLQKDRGTTR